MIINCYNRLRFYSLAEEEEERQADRELMAILLFLVDQRLMADATEKRHCSSGVLHCVAAIAVVMFWGDVVR